MNELEKYQEKMMEVITREIGNAYDLGKKRGVMIGMKRHTWMRDGITYVGSGTYTIKDAIRMAKKDGAICEDEE